MLQAAPSHHAACHLPRQAIAGLAKKIGMGGARFSIFNVWRNVRAAPPPPLSPARAGRRRASVPGAQLFAVAAQVSRTPIQQW